MNLLVPVPLFAMLHSQFISLFVLFALHIAFSSCELILSPFDASFHSLVYPVHYFSAGPLSHHSPSHNPFSPFDSVPNQYSPFAVPFPIRSHHLNRPQYKIISPFDLTSICSSPFNPATQSVLSVSPFNPAPIQSLTIRSSPNPFSHHRPGLAPRPAAGSLPLERGRPAVCRPSGDLGADTWLDMCLRFVGDWLQPRRAVLTP